MLSVMSTLSNVDIKTLPSGPAARSAPKNFSTESEKFSGAAPPRVTRGMEGFEIQIKCSQIWYDCSMRLIDSHCHLHDTEFFGDLREEVYERAAAAGVGMICVGTDERSSTQAVQFAKGHADVWAAVGVHPHDARLGWSEIGRLLQEDRKQDKPNIVAVGEIGLDYFYDNSPRDIQRQSLESQLQLAMEYHVPVSFHVRDAFDDFWPIFRNFPGVRGVLHSFTDSKENAEKGLSHNLYIGMNGISTFTKDAKQQELYRTLPLEKILLETDAPFLTPAPLRGRMNEVGYVELVAKHVASERHISLDEVTHTTLQNTRTLFNI